MWDTVPWFTEGGAEHSSEVARVLAYAAFAGGEGIVGAGDLQVRAVSTPAAAVSVLPGACAVLNRATGGKYQAYVARLPSSDQVPVAATGVSKRSDLIVARIENPYSSGETWPLPSNPKTGPYVFTRVISNVPPTTTSVRQIRPGDSAITLARIDIPANTSSITQSMIKDLRDMVNPRARRRLYTDSPAGDENWAGTTKWQWVAWPPTSRWTVEIPPWATKARIVLTLSALQILKGGVWGSFAWKLGPLQGESITFDTGATDGSERRNMIAADTISIPTTMRGTVQPLVSMMAMDNDQPGVFQADVTTSFIADVEWVEDPYEDES
ncbi:hypothetical protein [Streptomyces sp. NPDC088915]|uniref:hypothetical protein n=1 Tax=Streptomyces sp. NPDC088915 TaxID=3365912 RepID=UPI0037F6A00A